jgi:hypothetical protein
MQILFSTVYMQFHNIYIYSRVQHIEVYSVMLLHVTLGLINHTDAYKSESN